MQPQTANRRNQRFGTVKIENIDVDLHRTLHGELPGILNWCIKGAIKYYSEGLYAPDDVLAATDEYREDEDTIAGFMADRCDVAFDKAVIPSALYGNYEFWCKEMFAVGSGEAVLNKQRRHNTVRSEVSSTLAVVATS